MVLRTHGGPEFRGRSSERHALDRLLDDAREAAARVLVLRGAAGIGKTALLQYVAGAGGRVPGRRVAGIESEMELPFAGLHQLCAPCSTAGRAARAAAGGAAGRARAASGAAPDRFLVGLATLTLLAEVAEDAAAAVRGRRRAVARRRVGAGARCSSPGGCSPSRWRSCSRVASRARRTARRPAGTAARRARPTSDARALLDRRPGPLDERVRERIIAETRGNPLALLELPQSMSAAELAGGFGGPGAVTRADLEAGFRRRMDALPGDTRRLLQLAVPPTPRQAQTWCVQGAGDE